MDFTALSEVARKVIPQDRLPSEQFVGPLQETQQTEVLRALLLVYFLSLGNIIPRESQLLAVIESLSGRDGLVTAATGSGKTLIMIMLSLLRPDDISVLIVPLKRLQHSQLRAFASFGIPSVVINEDTPDDTELWTVSR